MLKRKRRRPKTRRPVERERRREEEYDEEDDESEMSFSLTNDTKRGVLVVVLFLIALISFLAFLELAGGLVGYYINDYLQLAFGWTKFLFPLILAGLAFVLLWPDKYEVGGLNIFGLLLFILTLNGLLHSFSVANENLPGLISAASQGEGGGYVGLALSYPLQKFMGFTAALIILAGLFIISVLITFNTSLHRLLDHFRIGKRIYQNIKILFLNFKYRNDSVRLEEEVAEELEFSQKEIKQSQGLDGLKTKDGQSVRESTQTKMLSSQPRLRRKIDLPLELLNGQVGKPTSGDIKANMETIRKTLENFNIPVEMGEVSVGPTVTQYTLRPAEGIKLNKITALHNDLALAMAAHPIRIEAPIPGKSLVGIEVPNQKVAIVPLRPVLDSPEFRKRASNLMIALGQDVAGKNWLADLDRMPHLLVAGSTGSGKTVALNTIIISLLYQNGPDDLKFIMVDPKRVELPSYNGIPHLLTPVITEVKKTVNALKWTIGEMDRRFELLSKFGKRDIHAYNRETSEKMFYIVVVVDELADLMAVAMAEVEAAIVRLAQMSRAVGIHLVLATQRPSVDIITGLIKANITSRIAFSVASQTDSRTILDMAGAEKLLGRGDMLYISSEISKPKRIQGAYVSDREIRDIVEFLKSKADPEYVEGVVEKQPVSGLGERTGFDGFNGDDDELLSEAKEVIARAGRASASLLQRRLKIGYARAARILDLLEEQGIVGPVDGAKPREVLVGRTEKDDYISEEDETEEVEENEDLEEENELEEDEEEPKENF